MIGWSEIIMLTPLSEPSGEQRKIWLLLCNPEKLRLTLHLAFVGEVWLFPIQAAGRRLPGGTKPFKCSLSLYISSLVVTLQAAEQRTRQNISCTGSRAPSGYNSVQTADYQLHKLEKLCQRKSSAALFMRPWLPHTILNICYISHVYVCVGCVTFLKKRMWSDI